LLGFIRAEPTGFPLRSAFLQFLCTNEVLHEVGMIVEAFHLGFGADSWRRVFKE
jgi:hypothetical protein